MCKFDVVSDFFEIICHLPPKYSFLIDNERLNVVADDFYLTLSATISPSSATLLPSFIPHLLYFFSCFCLQK